MPNPWGDVATWVTGIATIALFIVAFYQIRNERMARQRADNERLINVRRGQAEHIATWIVTSSFDDIGQFLWVAVRNQSLQPVYHLIAQGIVLNDDGTPRYDPRLEEQTRIAVVPPGEGYVAVHLDYGGMHRRPGIEIAFQDAAGRNWLRKTTGELLEINDSPVAYYGVPQPSGWQSLIARLPEEHEPNIG